MLMRFSSISVESDVCTRFVKDMFDLLQPLRQEELRISEHGRSTCEFTSVLAWPGLSATSGTIFIVGVSVGMPSVTGAFYRWMHAQLIMFKGFNNGRLSTVE